LYIIQRCTRIFYTICGCLKVFFVACNYEYLPSKTLDTKGKKSIWVRCAGMEKERATAMLLGDSNGNKHPVFIVMKSPKSKIPAMAVENLTARRGFGKHVWKEVLQHQNHSTQVYGNATAWWNGHLSKEFLEFHFGRRLSFSVPILLIWDDFSGHWTKDVVDYAKEINVILIRTPPSYTFACQPADVAWNKSFKNYLRAAWISYLQEHIRSRTDNEQFKLPPPSRSRVLQWIRDAWEALTPRTIENGFKGCLMPSLTDFCCDDDAEDHAEVDDGLLAMLHDLKISVDAPMNQSDCVFYSSDTSSSDSE
jgi:hypothetical protein